MNEYSVGSDGRTAYEIITGHKCRHHVMGIAEAVDFILELDKGIVHKADTRVKRGIFFGYKWHTTGYPVSKDEGILTCRKVRRRAEEVSYDSNCVDF